MEPGGPAKIRIQDFPAIFKTQPEFSARTEIGWADLGYTSKFGLRGEFKDEKSATRGRKSLGAMKTAFAVALSAAADDLPDVAKRLSPLLLLAEKALEDGTVTQKGTEVRAAFELKATKDLFDEAIKAWVTLSRREEPYQRDPDNLRALGFALSDYHASYDSLPPAASHDKAGKPLLRLASANPPLRGRGSALQGVQAQRTLGQQAQQEASRPHAGCVRHERKESRRPPAGRSCKLYMARVLLSRARRVSSSRR